MTLPASHQVCSSTLGSAFNDTTNSYKYLWFMAIFELIKMHDYKKLTYQLEDIAREMLTQAWAPSQIFRLSLGRTDKTRDILSSLKGLDSNRRKLSEVRSVLLSVDIKNAEGKLLR